MPSSDPPAAGTAAEHFDKVSASYERVTGGCTREVAQFLLTLPPTVDTSSVVLDNACGTGIITEEILERFPTSSKPKVYAADLAPSMVSSLSTKAASKGWVNGEDGLVEASVMDAEELTFPDNMFTHSYTNLGILFLKNPEKGASHIYRTLQPGGTAFVTTWSKLGYLSPVRRAQKAVRPDSTPWELPIGEEWFTEEKLRQVLESGGFKGGNIQIQTRTVSYRGRDLDDLVDIMEAAFSSAITGGWSEEDRAKLPAALRESLSDVEKANASIEMVAYVAVARK
jgi:ubiquinone/menaquinone biosynthesis C-methylase UbiE